MRNVVYLTPQGTPLTQAVVESLSLEKHLILLCGRYKGVDERVRHRLVTTEISIGDYVLSGGEIAALVLIDAIGRVLPGALGDYESAHVDSFSHDLLDHPHYTRPATFVDLTVPDVLLSGHHENIEKWRYAEALKRTAACRPDLLQRLETERRGYRDSQSGGIDGINRGIAYWVFQCLVYLHKYISALISIT